MESTSRTPETVALREDIAATRADLGETVDTLAAKTDVKTRATGAARQVKESVRRKPGRWAGAGTGVVALAAAAVGAVLWQRNRRRPVSRGARAWQAVTNRVQPLTNRFGR